MILGPRDPSLSNAAMKPIVDIFCKVLLLRSRAPGRPKAAWDQSTELLCEKMKFASVESTEEQCESCSKELPRYQGSEHSWECKTLFCDDCWHCSGG